MFSRNNLVFSKMFFSLSSKYNLSDLFFVLPIRNFSLAFSQNMCHFRARLPKKGRMLPQVTSLTFGMGSKEGRYPVFL